MLSHKFVGLASVLTACVLSGFSGVYYESLIKTGAQPSVVIRNVQLALPSVAFALAAVLRQDLDRVLAGDGLAQGYTPQVVLIVCLQAYSGMVVAVLIKYTDNIVKGFSSATSIVVSALGSYLLLRDLEPSALYPFRSCLM